MDNHLEFSHLCRNAWCINSAHIVLEDRHTNNSRKLCQLDRIRGKTEMADCLHEPRCMDTTKIGLAELKELIVELRDHRDDLRNTPASMCPFEDCAERDSQVSQHKLILHLCNEHPPGPISPLVKKELAWQCPRYDETPTKQGWRFPATRWLLPCQGHVVHRSSHLHTKLNLGTRHTHQSTTNHGRPVTTPPV
jgi:hypothetical protein